MDKYSWAVCFGDEVISVYMTQAGAQAAAFEYIKENLNNLTISDINDIEVKTTKEAFK